MNFLRKTGRFITGLFVRSGLCTFKFIAAVLLGIIGFFRFIWEEFCGLLQFAKRGFMLVFRSSTESFRKRVQHSNELTKNIRRAKKEGGKVYAEAVLQFIGSFFFGEYGVMYTAFNYILPVLCIVFTVGIITSGSSQRYGIAVDFNGKRL